MGVLNTTPDSFSDGGQFVQVEAALAQARRLEAEGADILDIGGESTRPGAASVPADEEAQRVVPVIEAIRAESEILISVDTSKAAVAAAALEAGADIVNDVTSLGDPAMGEVVARHRAGLVLMHMQGTPRTMQEAPAYEDVVAEVVNYLRQRMEAALGSGMAVESMVMDPGIGFGKTLEHNLSLLRNLDALAVLDRPILLGVSRKSFLARITGSETIEDRLAPALALTALGRQQGARIFRVHDPRPHLTALKMTEALHA